MTEFLAGGRRRIDRVLDPSFLQGIDQQDIDDVRRLRAEADQEEVDLSYARRLLQGRIDLMRAEQQRRRGEGPLVGVGTRSDEAIVEALKRILSDSPRPDRGGGRHISAQPTRVGEHRREAERAVADVGGSDLEAMADDELADAVGRLTDIETRISRSRRLVQQVVDALTDEVARRYRLDHPALVEH